MPRKSELQKQICKELNGLDQISDLSVLKELRNPFSFLEDSRHPTYTKHKWEDIVMITLLAVLADVNEWYKNEVFARKYSTGSSQILELPNGVPSHGYHTKGNGWDETGCPAQYRCTAFN